MSWDNDAPAEVRRVWFPPEDDARVLAPPGGWLGVDVGWVFPAVDSDGLIYHWASPRERSRQAAPTPAGPVTIRRIDGSVEIREPYDESGFADVMARAQDEEYRRRLRNLCSNIIRKARESERGLALEDWRDFNRRRSAWTDVWRKLMAMAPERGVAVRTVKSAYTSQTCPACGHVARGNRPDRNSFVCLMCGHSGQADRIAAVNIAAKATAGTLTFELRATCENPACDRAVWKAKRCQSCYFHARRHRGRLPDADEIETLVVARNYSEFLRALEA